MSYAKGEVEDKFDHAFKDPGFNNLSTQKCESAEKIN